MNSPQPPDSTFAWDQYWSDGRLASCGGEGGANYQSAIAEGWRQFFNCLRNGAHVLDICTGNGAIARLAAETARAHNLSVAIEAADSATLHPTGLGPGSEMIHFSPRTPAESLPFPDASFDVIVGQYAIEYTDLDRSMVELRRVSQRTADIRFVTHAAGSVVARGAGRQLEDVDRLTGTGVFEASEAFVRAAGNPLSATPPDEAHRNFLVALQALQDASASAEDLVMYRNVGSVIVDAIQQMPHIGTAPVLAKILETGRAIKAHQARLSAMRRAALDESGAQGLASLAGRLWNMKFELAPLVRSDGALFGWVLASTQQAG